MQNLVNLNPLELTSKSAATNKSSSSQTAAVPFQQMLSQEIAQKSPAPAQTNNNSSTSANGNKASANATQVKQANINKPPSTPKTEAKPNNTQASDANNKAEKATNTDTSNNVSASTETDTTNSSEKTSKVDETEDSKDDSTQQLSADQSGNAQLLALVVNVGQFVADQSNSAKADEGKVDQSESDTDASATLATSIGADTDKQLANKTSAEAEKLSGATDANAAKLTQSAQSSPEFAKALKEIQAQSEKSDAKINKELNPTDTNPNKAQSKDADSELISTSTNTLNNAPSNKLANDAKAIILQAQTDIKNQSGATNTDATSTPAIQGISTAMATNIQRAADAASTHLAPPVGTPAWDQAVGQKVVWMVAGGQQSAEMTLNPPDLGPLKVILSINNDQANASFTSAQPEVRAALESAMPKLRQMMDDAGISLTGFSVNSQASQGFAFQQSANSFAQQSSQSNQSGNRANNQFVNAPIPVVSGTATIRNGSLGGVDLFA
jgi:flagellar hook-length control protein FliK